MTPNLGVRETGGRPKAQEYRAKAAECVELALKTKDPQSKRVLQLTAEQWRALADSADKLHLYFN
jgi:hypothetical protein